jgi:hypothetical protein
VFLYCNLQVFCLDLHIFHTYVLNVCSKICFRRMLHSSVLYCKYFMFQRCVQRVMGHNPSARGWGAASRVSTDGARSGQRSGRMAPLVPANRGMLVLIPAPTSHPRGERGVVSLEGATGTATRSECTCGALRGGQGRAARVSGRAHPDVQTLATPLSKRRNKF